MTRPVDDHDDFWRELRLELIPDDLSPEEAAQRMAEADDEVLPPERVDRIVREVLAREATGAPGAGGEPAEVTDTPPAWPRFRLLQGVPVLGQLSRAAVVILGVSLIACGYLAVSMLWPESRYSRLTLRYDDATWILMDEDSPEQKRSSAAHRVFAMVNGGVKKLKELSSEPGGVGFAAGLAVMRLRERLEDESPEPLFSEVESIVSLVGVASDTSLSERDRTWAIRQLEREVGAGLSCLMVLVARGGSTRLDLDAAQWLRTIRSRLVQ